MAAALGHQLLSSSSSTAAFPIDVLRSEHRGALGETDSAVPEGTTVFDDGVPGVAKLDPALLGALRQAATDAADDRVEFFVDSGWRSPEYQEQLLREAVSEYGSEAEAARWVATPNTSAHVSGDAVDIGPFDATAWLSEHGAEYGLCQIYRNEPWHYELRTEAIDRGCPPMYADPTHDPRMQQ
jgi:LAS superfamily LD-carboxypeptidase LdcB